MTVSDGGTGPEDRGPDGSEDEVEVLRRTTVPDDASALELDRQAWLRERAAARRRARASRVLITRRQARYGISGPVVVLALLLVALTAGAAVVLLAPSAGQGAVRALPLATVPSGTDEGELLPSDLLVPAEGGASATDVRDLRPSVVLLLPASCPACRGDVEQLIRSAHSRGLFVHAVLGSRPADLTAARALVAEPPSGGGAASLSVDSGGALFAAYPVEAARPTVLVVGRDGVLLARLVGWTRDVGLTDLDRAAGLR